MTSATHRNTINHAPTSAAAQDRPAKPRPSNHQRADAKLIALGRELEASWAHEIALYKSCDHSLEFLAAERRAMNAGASIFEKINACRATTIDGALVMVRSWVWNSPQKVPFPDPVFRAPDITDEIMQDALINNLAAHFAQLTMSIEREMKT